MDEKKAPVVRELSRAVVQLHLPSLYREYVNRHSILSRFCQNLAIGIAVVILALFVSLGLLVLCRRNLSERFLCPQELLILGVGSAVIIGGMVAIVALWIRATKLRLRMTKHTFELFYLDHLGVAKTSSQDWS
jgi:hypothetical protein